MKREEWDNTEEVASALFDMATRDIISTDFLFEVREVLLVDEPAKNRNAYEARYDKLDRYLSAYVAKAKTKISKRLHMSIASKIDRLMRANLD